MATDRPILLSFNRGEVSKHALARVDLEKLRLSAEVQENFLPYVLGPMTLRPGLQHLGGINGNLRPLLVPFKFSNTDTALVELTENVLRVWEVDDDSETLITRPSVSTVVTNGDFSASAGWTLTTTGTGASATISGGKLTMDSPATGGIARAARTVTVSAGDQGDEHAFRIIVDRGPVVFRCGSTDGGDEVVSESTLATGTHSLAFTPAVGTLYIQLETTTAQAKIIDSITIEAAGVLELPTPWDEDDLSLVRYDQSGDIIYCACQDNQQRQIERRGTGRSWSVVKYLSNDGPFGAVNGSDITMTPSVLTGNGTLTASRNFFRATHAGALFRLFSTGQTSSASLVAENSFSTAIRVSGTDSQRIFDFAIEGEWAGTITLQRSLESATTGFADVPGKSFTANTSQSYDDGLDNLVAWYRLGFKTGDYDSNQVTNGSFAADSDWTKGTGWTISAGVASSDGSQAGNSDLTQTIAGLESGNSYEVTYTVSNYSAGNVRLLVGGATGTNRTANGTYVETVVASSTDVFGFRADLDFIGSIDNVSIAPLSADVSLTYAGGGAAGICRVTGFTSATVVDIEVLSAFSSLAATENWNEGDWSDRRGWPSSVTINGDGRLYWAGRDKLWGSVADNFTSFDIDFDGDAGPINRRIANGPVDTINWLLPLTRLLVGRQGSETSVRSSSLDEGLTPTNVSFRDCSTQGSAAVQAAKVDTRGIFVQQSGRRVYELSIGDVTADYAARDLTRLNLNIGAEGFREIDVQRQPDTVIHLTRGDGQVVGLVYENDDAVEALIRIVSDGADGEVESCAVLPGSMEDKVYYAVKRTIGGSTVRYLEKMARRDQCRGLPEARLADSHLIYSGAATTTITGLTHLEGESVIVWGWNTATPFTVTLPDGSTQTVGRDMGTFTVSGGQITGLPAQVTNACVGLVYVGKFKSAKLAYGALRGSSLTQKKKIDKLGLILIDTHYQGLEYGQSFDTMDNLPLVEEAATTAAHTIWEDYDAPMTALPGEWDTDARLCLRATAPRPCTVAAAVVQVTTNE